MTNKTIKLYSLSFAVFSYLTSYTFFQYYIKGDQTDYVDFYDNVRSFGIVEGYAYYKSRLGSGEPVYYLFVYFLSPLISKLSLFSSVNAVLGFYLIKGLLRLKMAPILLVPLAFNFYLLVLFLAAERLKLSLTFFIMALNMQSKRSKVTLFSFSLLSHFQSIFLILTLYVKVFAETLKNFFIGRFSVKSLKIVVLCFMGGIFFFYFEDILIRKVTGYSQSFKGIDNIYKPLLFCLLTLFYSKGKRLEVVIMHLPIIVASYFVGDIRMTIFSFFIFMYYGVQHKKGLNFGVLASLLYFFIQGIFFLQKVLIHGEGFFINK